MRFMTALPPFQPRNATLQQQLRVLIWVVGGKQKELGDGEHTRVIHLLYNITMTGATSTLQRD